jgi:hypothetical protein
MVYFGPGFSPVISVSSCHLWVSDLCKIDNLNSRTFICILIVMTAVLIFLGGD